MSSTIDVEKLKSFVFDKWDSSIVPSLIEFIKIPNLSPVFDPLIQQNGLQEKVVDLMTAWVKEQNVEGLKLEVVKIPNRTPIIFMEVEATAKGAGTVLLYGHMDKQPPFTGWADDLGPYKPVLKEFGGDLCLYGRGGADDGYAIYAAITAIKALKEQNIPHGRCVIIIEGSEESGSPDLPFYIEQLKDRIGTPNYIVCLDSGAGNYKQLWVTTSLRGVLVAELSVTTMSEGVHSGSGSGVVADSFRICRALLSRLEDEQTGRIIPKDFYCEIPKARIEQTAAAAKILGKSFYESYPVLNNLLPMENDLTELMLNRTWKPILTITGADCLPPIAQAGNVLRPSTSLKLSLRIPPAVDGKKASQALKTLMEKDPPYNSIVKCTIKNSGTGWDAPALADWVGQSIQKASQTYFNADAAFQGEGGSIPFMGMLGEAFPKAQFLITGVLGPSSNAHGPNEFLNIPFAKKLTCCVANALADHALVQQ